MAETRTAGRPDHRNIGDIVVRQPFGWRWALGFAFAVAGTLAFAYAVAVLFVRGVGIWGTNHPYMWAFDIIGYVWWIGIANATSLFAAALTVRRAEWRTPLNRFAEAAALFAVICAGLFPILHLGRPWLFHWVFPYPSTFGVWPQFRSPLVWDFFAILTHLIVTALFWFVGLIPDFAHLRDRARSRLAQRAFGVLALGWRGSARHWINHQRAYHTLAGLVLAMVVFMQSTVSFEFAVTVVPEWHQPRYPPYFVVSGLLSGLGMVLVVALMVRRLLGLHGLITIRHVEVIAVLLLANSVVVAWSYGFEAFSSWYAGPIERQALLGRVTGDYAAVYWGAVACTIVLPQVLWIRRIRRSPAALVPIGLLVNLGILLDRFMIVVGGFLRDYLPSAWGDYAPTGWEWPLLAGTAGLFAALMLL
ncbi:MAG TPA: NrfD/PsrC family molybdoenzyme membrane anchor subunit, partial [Arenibaculum sp.]|nr:NrfD/PsrC family molybdoenzyme membrane anchor subunit [Arenibaculum sp.]